MIGRRLTLYHDRRSLLANIAFGERERHVLPELLGAKTGYREAYIFRPGGTYWAVSTYYQRMTYIPVRPRRLALSPFSPFDRIVDAIDEFRPDVLVGDGSYLETMFRVLASRAIPMHRPRVVMYAADTMTDPGRRFIEEHFGIPVLSRYNAGEAFKISFFCEERRGFHIHEDLCHVKIVDRAGRRVAAPRHREVVISNLVNRGTVLLNYRLGDLASLSSERCPCGRSLPLLTELRGKVADTVFLRDGRFVAPRRIAEVIQRAPEVLQYQLVQREPTRFELRLVTEDRAVYERIICPIRHDLLDLLPNVALESDYCEQLRQDEPGKFKAVVALLPDGA